MKTPAYWIIVISAFALGFFANEYWYHQSDTQTQTINTNLQNPVFIESPQNTIAQSGSDNPLEKTSTEPSLESIHQLINHQEYDKAVDLLRRYLHNHQDDVQAWYWLATTYQSQGKLTLAVETWFEYLAREVDANRISNAITHIKRLLQQLGQNSTISNNNAPWLTEQINKLLDISVNDSQLHMMLAQLYLNTGDNYQAQYHALMAVNDPTIQQQAEKILAQLNGDISDEPMQLPLTRYGEQFILTVQIEGNPANLLVDTGASISGVTSRYAEKYASIIKNTKPVRLNTASGTKDSYLFTVNSLHMGDAHFAQHMLAVLPMDGITEFDGLLGVDILGKFNFVIDQNNTILKLSPRQ